MDNRTLWCAARIGRKRFETVVSSSLDSLQPDARFRSVLQFATCLGHLRSVSGGVRLTTDAERAGERGPEQPSLHAEGPGPSDQPDALVKPLYRALRTCAKRLQEEALRYKTTEILSADEVTWLEEKVPGAHAALKAGDGCLDDFISVKFREPCFSKQDVGRRLDRGLAALSAFSQRANLLRRHAVSSCSDHLSHGIRVMVEAKFNLDHRSGALYHYKVKLRNEAVPEPVQLICRHWIITDFDGNTREVIGPGVIGEKPILDEGSEFEYSSFTPLQSKRGTQRGTFSMLGLHSKELFDVAVGPFALAPPHTFRL